MPISSEPAERAEGWLYNAVLYKRFEHLQISVSTGESWNQSSTNIERTTVIKVHDTTSHVGECVYVCVYIYMVCVFIYTSNVYMCLCVHTYTHRCVFVSSVAQSCLTLYDPMHCSLPGSSVHGDSPDKNTGVGCHSLLQGIFLTQGLRPGFPHCRRILDHLSHQSILWPLSNQYKLLLSLFSH